ncbi:MAG: hypothetical protein IPP15_23550 [Saprospiraceae bacterium]|uniref:Uncharacterized protein n=1 Tax=Candidatus Opimibacter skivensis TaxID=2982028 RepID=A0A9D7T2T0_9BACT|nr:hypothetical protein [Candidatus Opimibacter skivensis]
MNKKRIFLILVLVNILNHVQAEIFPTLSIVELSIKSDKVMEAKYLSTSNGIYKFCGHEINSNKPFLDTFEIDGLERIYSIETDEFQRETVGFDQAEAILVYINVDKGGKYNATFSGFRLLVNGKILVPFQFMNPGKFSFSPINDTITWSNLKQRIESVDHRIRAIQEIRKLDDSLVRNQLIFQWLAANRQEFGKRCGLNEDCGWGSIEYDIFKWITEANISKDTWLASKLFREVRFSKEVDWIGFTGILGDYGGKSFATYSDIDFLISTALNELNLTIDRKQALSFLVGACRKVYENNYPIPSASMLKFQKAKQKEIRDKIIPLLSNENFKLFAFEIVRALSNPMDGILEHRIDLEALPLIKNIYLNEAPSEYRSNLAYFIVHNSTREEWKAFVGNDLRIFMDLYQVYVDTTLKTLSFGIYYNYGRETIKDAPMIIIENIGNGKQIHQELASDMRLPYESWNGVQYLKVDISSFPSGNYKVYVTGKAGVNSEGYWKSEYGTFQLK